MLDLYTKTEGTIFEDMVFRKRGTGIFRKQFDAIEAARPSFRPTHEIRNNYMTISRAVGYKIKNKGRIKKGIKTLIEVRIRRC